MISYGKQLEVMVFFEKWKALVFLEAIKTVKDSLFELVQTRLLKA